MYNYTKTVTLERLGGKKAKEVAREAGCHLGTVYAYLQGKLGEASLVRQKIDQLLETGKVEIEAKESIKERTGLSAQQIIDITKASRASVYGWHNRKLNKEEPCNIDYKIDALIKEHQSKN